MDYWWTTDWLLSDYWETTEGLLSDYWETTDLYIFCILKTYTESILYRLYPKWTKNRSLGISLKAILLNEISAFLSPQRREWLSSTKMWSHDNNVFLSAHWWCFHRCGLYFEQGQEKNCKRSSFPWLRQIEIKGFIKKVSFTLWQHCKTFPSFWPFFH